MKFRVITGGIILNDQGQYLLCQMASDHGVYPDQWGIVGGGVDPDEEIDHAMIREIREESALKVKSLRRLFFADAHKHKTLRGIGMEEQYLLFLVYEASVTGQVQLNDEWQTYKWCNEDEVLNLDLNDPTRRNFENYLRLKKADALPPARTL